MLQRVHSGCSFVFVSYKRFDLFLLQTLLAANLYIPIGAPIRWSMVRAGLEGFSENPWNVHPLFPLSRAPI